MPYSFVVAPNLTIDTEGAASSGLHNVDVPVEETTDLFLIGRETRAHKPDLACILPADWFRSLRDGEPSPGRSSDLRVALRESGRSPLRVPGGGWVGERAAPTIFYG